jgi:hypothetical protein
MARSETHAQLVRLLEEIAKRIDAGQQPETACTKASLALEMGGNRWTRMMARFDVLLAEFASDEVHDGLRGVMLTAAEIEMVEIV